MIWIKIRGRTFLHPVLYTDIKPSNFTLDADTMKPVFSSTDGNRCRLIYCRCHTACRKTVPDQLIQPEQISAQRILHYAPENGSDPLDGLPHGHPGCFVSVFLCIYAAAHIIVTIMLHVMYSDAAASASSDTRVESVRR